MSQNMLNVYNFLYMVCVFYMLDIVTSRYVTRETAYGLVRGFVTQRGTPVPVEQFLGIPYVSPPVGNLRFERPQKPKPWNKPLDTLFIPPACPQVQLWYIQNHSPGFNKTSEDCLYLNVYVPKVPKNKKLPVLLYIHGGGNEGGMGAMLDGDILAGYGDIVVVTFNYRLGVLGFLAVQREGVSGNYGLLDQVEAMKWVKENIHNFNGNPNEVTIHGHSAGAADAGFHIVSPLSKGLFRYVVLHSGSPLCFWAFSEKRSKTGININIHLLENVCPLNSSFIECLKNATVEQLIWIRGQSQLPRLVALQYLTVVDGYFLTDSPEKLMQEGNISGEALLLSFTKDEWAHLVSGYSEVAKMRELLTEFQPMFPSVCLLEDLVAEQYHLEKINENTSETARSFSDMISDILFKAPMVRTAELMSNWTSNVYVSTFTQSVNFSGFEFPRLLLPDFVGPLHGEDIFYLFGVPLVSHTKYNFTEKDKDISKLMIKFYSNFVKYGFLTLDGKTEYAPYNSKTKIVHSLQLDTDGTFVKEIKNFKSENMNFWNKYLPQIEDKMEDSRCISNGDGLHFSACHKYFYSTLIVFLISQLLL